MHWSLNWLEMQLGEFLWKADNFELSRCSSPVPQICGSISWMDTPVVLAECNTLKMPPQHAEHNTNYRRVLLTPNSVPSTTASSPPPSLHTQAHPAQNASADIHMIEFDNIRLTFDAATVSDAPTITFTDDVDALFRGWYQSKILIIAGQGIPVWQWDKFYVKRAKIKKHTWTSLQFSWHNWKVSGCTYK